MGDIFDTVANPTPPPAQPPAQAQAQAPAQPTQSAQTDPTATQPAGDMFDQVAANPNLAFQSAPVSTLQPYDASQFGRYTTAQNYKQWASTPPKAGPDSKPGEYEAWTGAHLSPTDSLKAAGTAVGEGAAVAGTAVGIPAAVDAIPAVLPHTIEGVKAITAWASKNPVPAYMLFQVMKELIPGAKKAMGIVKGVPD